MKWFIAALAFNLIISLPGCSLFKNKREEVIKERLQKIQDEIDKRADSIRKQRLREFNDSSNKEIIRSLDSIKRSSDSLEKVIKKNIEELKKKNK